MFEMPFVSNVEFAQQGLDHGSLRFESQCSVLLMMAFPPSRGNWHMFLRGSAEASALRPFRDWLADVILAQTEEAGFLQLDKHPDSVRLARELAKMVLETSPRA